MKRKLLNRSLLKQVVVAVPASALMLGSSQAGTSIGINFWGAYGSYGYGGAPVTATAFGLPPTAWYTTPASDWQTAANGSMTAGSLTVNWSAQNTWVSVLHGDPNSSAGAWNSPLPGDWEVLWGYLDDGNGTTQAPAASVSGLSSVFPNGYVIQTLAAEDANPVTIANVNITNAVTTNTLVYSSYFHTYDWYGPVAGANAGTYALSPQSAVFTDDTIGMQCDIKGTTGQRSVLCGFIITDQPVASQTPTGGGLYNFGSTVSLSAAAVGIPPLSYQWQHAGTNVPGANSSTYVKAGAASADAGDYQLVVTNLYGAATSAVATVTVIMTPTILTDLPATATNYLTMNQAFFVVAAGQQPLAYQWSHAGTNLPGATASALALNNLQAANAGSYQVIVTNSLGSATSAVASLTVIGPPPYEGFAYPDGDIADQNGGNGWATAWTNANNGQNYVVSPGATYRDASSDLVVSGSALQMAAAGSADFESQRGLAASLGGDGTIYLSFLGQFINSGWGGLWLYNGGSEQLFIGQGWEDSPWGFGGFPYPQFLSTKDSRVLSFVVCRLDITPTNTFVRMYVNPPLNAEPDTADASGTISTSIQFDTVQVATHNYPGPMPDGIFDEFRIGASWASVTPNVPRTDPPVFLRDLAGVTTYAYAGGSATMSVQADGAPTLHYQWKLGATPVGADSSTLTLTSLTAANTGDYSVTVSNPYGTTNSMVNHLTVVASPDVYTSQVIPDAPGAFWPLNETVGPTAYDYSGGSKDGTLTGSLPSSGPGPRPPAYQGFSSGTVAYQFDGASYVDCGTRPSLSGTADFTVEAWINTTNNANGDVFSQRDDNVYNGEFELQVRGNGRVYFYVYGSSGYQFSITSAANGPRVNDGKWHHIAGVRSGTNGIIYIDGSAITTGSSSTTLRALDPTANFSLGVNLRGHNSYFLGQMCDLALYNYALPAARIGAHAYKGWLNTSPLKLAITSGGWVEDTKPVGQPYDGLNLGASWVASVTDAAASPVTRTGVAQFSSGAQVAIPANADFNSPTGSICFWMRVGLPPAGTGMMLFDRRTTAGLVLVLDGTPTGGFGVQYTGNTSFSAGGYVVDENWHQVTLTYDQSATGTVTLYVEGANVGSQANTAAWSWPTTQQIELARSHDTYWQEYNGQMDDFRIYNRVLTDTEIATIAAPATSDDLVDTNALKVRYNFGTAAGVGRQLSWPIGVLQGAAAIGSPTAWAPVLTTSPSYPFLPPYAVTNTARFYELKVY